MLKKNIKDFNPNIDASLISTQVVRSVACSAWSLIWVSITNLINEKLSTLIENDLQNKF